MDATTNGHFTAERIARAGFEGAGKACRRPDSVRCSWGCSALAAGEGRPFGLLSVEVVHVAT